MTVRRMLRPLVVVLGLLGAGGSCVHQSPVAPSASVPPVSASAPAPVVEQRSHAVPGALPDIHVPGYVQASAENAPNAFKPDTAASQIAGIDAIIATPFELRDRARYDRIVVWVKPELRVYPAGKTTALWRNEDFAAQPIACAWIGDDLLAWSGRQIALLDGATGKSKWMTGLSATVEPATEPSTEPSTAPATMESPEIRGVCPICGRVQIATSGGLVLSILTASGQLSWCAQLNDQSAEQLLANDDFTVVRGDDEGADHLYAFRSGGSEPVFQLQMPKPLFEAVAVVDASGAPENISANKDLLASPDLTLMAIKDPEMQQAFPELSRLNMSDSEVWQKAFKEFSGTVTTREGFASKVIEIVARRVNPDESIALANSYGRALCTKLRDAPPNQNAALRQTLERAVADDLQQNEMLTALRNKLPVDSQFERKAKDYAPKIAEIVRLREAMEKTRLEYAAAKVKFQGDGTGSLEQKWAQATLTKVAIQNDILLQMLTNDQAQATARRDELGGNAPPDDPGLREAQRQVDAIDAQITQRLTYLIARVEGEISKTNAWQHAATAEQARDLMDQAQAELTTEESQLKAADPEAVQLADVQVQLDSLDSQIAYVQKRLDGHKDALHELQKPILPTGEIKSLLPTESATPVRDAQSQSLESQICNAALAADGTLVWTTADHLMGKQLRQPGPEPTFYFSPDLNPQTHNRPYEGGSRLDNLLIVGDKIIVMEQAGRIVSLHSLKDGSLIKRGSGQPDESMLATGLNEWNWKCSMTVADNWIYAVGPHSVMAYDIDRATGHFDGNTRGFRVPVNFKMGMVTQSALVVVDEPTTHPSKNGALYRLFIYSRELVPEDPGAEESGLITFDFEVTEPAGIRQWAVADGGVYYLSGDNTLHFLQGSK